MLDSNKKSYRFLVNIPVLALVLWVIARPLVFTDFSLYLYKTPIGSIPSHLYLDRIATFKFDCDNSGVLIIGPSSVREGFDSDLISSNLNKCTINGGVTSPGSVFHTELQLDVLRNFGISADVIVLGVNSRMLVNRHNPIGKNRYIDFLKREQIDYLIGHESQSEHLFIAKQSLKNDLWPAARLH